MKPIRLVILPFVLALMLAFPAVALAAGNTTTIEQKWLDFQKAVTDQMVKDGKMTRQDADARIKQFQTKFAESPGDSIYEFFAARNLQQKDKPGICKDGKCRKGDHDGPAFGVYSMLSGKTVADLKKACESGNITIWELAKKDGKLDLLKTKLLDTQQASLDVLVKGGVMTDQQRSNILGHMKDELSKK